MMNSQSDHLIQIPPPEGLESEFLHVSFDVPPSWHQAILKERCKAFEEGKETSRSLDDAIKELKIELGIKD